MSELSDKVASFKERQTNIMILHDEMTKAVNALGDQCQERVNAINTEFEVKKAEFGQALEAAKTSYKADLKEAFGVTDGESANILDLVQLIHRLAPRND